MKPLIAVTGATGNVGREVVRQLLARGFAVRAAVSRSGAARAVELLGTDVALSTFDFERPATFEALLEDAQGLFLLRPPAISRVDTTLNALVDTAARRRVEHVVFLSVAGAETNRLVPHHAVERRLIDGGGVAWSILRPGFFAQNLGDAYRRDIAEDGRLYLPAGRGRVAFVDVRDLAEVAAKAFETPSLRNQAWTLTGPEAVDFDHVARVLAAALQEPVRYVPASIPGYLLHLRRRGLPWMQIIVQTILHVGLRFGQAERPDPTLEQLLGRRPRTIEDYVRDELALWSGPDRAGGSGGSGRVVRRAVGG